MLTQSSDPTSDPTSGHSNGHTAIPLATAQRVFMMMAGVWVGIMSAAGLLVPMTIFNYLTDKQVAGMVAGEIFKNTSFINLTLGLVLLVFANYFVKRTIHHYRLIRWCLLIIMILTLTGAFVIQPWMGSLRETALLDGFPVMQSPLAGQFRLLHGVSSSIFLLELILGCFIFWRSSKII